MSIALATVGTVLLVAGFVGCVVPVIPGPILGYCGLLALLPTEWRPSTAALVALGVMVAVVTVADYVVPAIGAKKFDCSRGGTWGCFAGTLVGVFFFPLGLVLGPFLGALAGELMAGKSLGAASKGGLGALLGFLSGVFLKIVACAVMSAVFVMAVI